jgi:hypothetical protein
MTLNSPIVCTKQSNYDEATIDATYTLSIAVLHTGLFSFLKGGVKKEPRSLSKYSVFAAQMKQCKALYVYSVDGTTHPLF